MPRLSPVAVIALLLPFVVENFLIFQLTLAMIYAIAILGLNLLTGFNGQFSLGHSRLLRDRRLYRGDPDETVSTSPITGRCRPPALVCFVFGFLFGLPALRLEGIYLALATFALAVAMPQILKSTPLEPWTGGVQGIVIIKPDAPFGLPLNADQWLYFFTLARRASCMYRRRRQPGQQPHRPRHHGDPRQSDRGARDGHRCLALQDR